jgi:uncharacterized membrane protein YeiB
VERVTGVDAVRGLAVLGMFTAHLGDVDDDPWTATGWLQVADGRSAATFALLAGVAAALLSGGPDRAEGRDLRRSRIRILVRCVLLWALGAAMIALDTPVAVILPSYALMLAVLLVPLRASARVLLGAAGVVLLVGPPVVVAAQRALEDQGGDVPQVLDLLVGHAYPALVWMAYLLVGLAVGRMRLGDPRTAPRLAAWGALVAVLGYGTGWVAQRLLPDDTTEDRLLLELVSIEPHANTAPEVVGNIGVALLLLAGCLVLGRRLPWLLVPVAATGALALTAYCAHLVFIAVRGDGIVWDPSNMLLAGLVAVTVLAATVWRRWLGRGPLERVVHWPSSTVAQLLVPRTEDRADRAEQPASR